LCLNVDFININEIEDDCDNEVSKEHADVLLGVDEIGSILSIFDSNFAHMDIKELNVFIQQKWICCWFRIYVFGCFVLNILEFIFGLCFGYWIKFMLLVSNLNLIYISVAL